MIYLAQCPLMQCLGKNVSLPSINFVFQVCQISQISVVSRRKSACGVGAPNNFPPLPCLRVKVFCDCGESGGSSLSNMIFSIQAKKWSSPCGRSCACSVNNNLRYVASHPHPTGHIRTEFAWGQTYPARPYLRIFRRYKRFLLVFFYEVPSLHHSLKRSILHAGRLWRGLEVKIKISRK